MARIYHDSEADLGVLKSRRVGSIGFGNQGRAQSHNLRDSGVPIRIGNIDDEYRERAIEDGFDVVSIPEIAEQSDVLLMLIPDEVQPEVYERDVAPHLKPGDALCFASGYNIFYRCITPPEEVDTILVAPRMIGRAVRSLYEQQEGYPCLVGFENDASGDALRIALAIARGIGATRLGAFHSSFREEALIDLFAEQMLWAGINRLALTYFEKLVEHGCDPEIVATELHLSGEFLEIARAMITEGFFNQLRLHSHTSQYGQLSRGDRMVPPALQEEIAQIMGEIESGAFAKEWAQEQADELPTLRKLWEQAVDHPLSHAEARLEALRQVVAKAHLGD